MWKHHQSPFVFALCHQEAHEASIFFQGRALIPEKAAKETHKTDKQIMFTICLLQKELFSVKNSNQTINMNKTALLKYKNIQCLLS